MKAVSTNTTAAINAARRVASLRGADDKLDALAKAIEALASAVADIEKAVQPPK
jgi:hypothetical protein